MHIFHSTECWRCGEGVQHRELPRHYVNGCRAGVSSAMTESSDHTALTVADMKAMLGCLNHDQLLPVIQSQLNELTHQARNQEARFAEISRELGACEQNLKAEMEQIAARIYSTVSHQRTSQQNPLEEASTSRSLSLRSGQDLILRKLEHLVNLQHSRQTSPKPDFGLVIARWETVYSDVRHLTSALSTTARIEEISWATYLLALENCEEILQSQRGNKKVAEVTVWHMRDTYFTIAVWFYNGSPSELAVEIEFNGMLVDSMCWPPFWHVQAVDKVTLNERSLASCVRRCYCKRDDPLLEHFHLQFRIDTATLKNDGYLRDGKTEFEIFLNNTEEDNGVKGAP
ncbi:uncharacterized protein LOC142557381 isoform X2 [Dermacentor variabilis]|uniref:uncharacterized protein LOC142557381 isoform X2 n=1 Tax=Dermacentor variabilis TaxID=34621 RepID=UPI003F5CB1EC